MWCRFFYTQSSWRRRDVLNGHRSVKIMRSFQIKFVKVQHLSNLMFSIIKNRIFPADSIVSSLISLNFLVTSTLITARPVMMSINVITAIDDQAEARLFSCWLNECSIWFDDQQYTRLLAFGNQLLKLFVYCFCQNSQILFINVIIIAAPIWTIIFATLLISLDTQSKPHWSSL